MYMDCLQHVIRVWMLLETLRPKGGGHGSEGQAVEAQARLLVDNDVYIYNISMSICLEVI